MWVTELQRSYNSFAHVKGIFFQSLIFPIIDCGDLLKKLDQLLNNCTHLVFNLRKYMIKFPYIIVSVGHAAVLFITCSTSSLAWLLCLCKAVISLWRWLLPIPSHPVAWPRSVPGAANWLKCIKLGFSISVQRVGAILHVPDLTLYKFINCLGVKYPHTLTRIPNFFAANSTSGKKFRADANGTLKRIKMVCHFYGKDRTRWN